MTKSRKLELTWVGKEERPRLEPRILIEDAGKSRHAGARRPGDLFDNMLIKGDNLLALKALEADFAGKVKCVFIDPPYNTGSAFTHYDDGMEHSLWLSMMRDRLEIIRRLLSEDGSLWVTLDDNEAHYFKVMADEVFGRGNFVASICWQARYSVSSDSLISNSHNFVHVYAKSIEIWKKIRNPTPRSERQARQYSNPDNDPRGPWRAIPWDAPNIRPNLEYDIITPTGRIRRPPRGRCWSRTEDQWLSIVNEGLAFFGKNGDGAPSFKRYLADDKGVVPSTWWPHEDAGHTDEAAKEMHGLYGRDKAFSTPKPERLIHRILHIATNPGDLVLDSFAGSGTTGAVAHKMGRRWIMVEIGEHADTHILPRLAKVIDGEDKGGVTEATGWKGGGGFRYFTLAPSLLEKDKYGNWVVSKEYNPAMLSQAVCRHLGYVYAPSDEQYWNHGHSTERDFIYVTTQSLTHAACARLSADVGPERSLLVCCKAFATKPDAFPNLTLKKIPASILTRCEWGRDDYSLAIRELPQAPEEPPEATEAEEAAPAQRGADDLPLFGGAK